MNSFNIALGMSQTSSPFPEKVINLAQALLKLQENDLSSQEQLFSELDQILDGLSTSEIDAVLSDQRFLDLKDRLHQCRTDYEYDREILLAQDIIAQQDAGVAEAFRSHDWYDKALDFETNALNPFKLKRILFVGSGPFPTSPMAFLKNNPKAKVTCMERSLEACELATKVATIFGLPTLEILNLDGTKVTDFTAYDCVIVGLVVGANDTEKQPIVDHFLKTVPSETLLCFRSADGPGQIIYPRVDQKALAPYNVDVLQGPPHKSFTMIIVKR